MPKEFTCEQRETIIKILESVCRNGLKAQHDIDVAIDAIEAVALNPSLTAPPRIPENFPSAVYESAIQEMQQKSDGKLK